MASADSLVLSAGGGDRERRTDRESRRGNLKGKCGEDGLIIFGLLWDGIMLHIILWDLDRHKR